MAHFSLVLVGLMWSLPFLYYYHRYPLTTFYQEWGTALLGLSALPLLLTQRFWRAPQVPGIVLLPIGLILVLLLQFMQGRVIHLDHVLLVALYLLFAALLAILGQHLRATLGMAPVATVLAVSLLIGAELNTLAGLVQHYNWETFLNSVVVAKVSSRVYGNLAQANHFANYVTLGLLSLGLLQHRYRISWWLTALLAAPMLFVMVLSGSRSGALYLVAALALAWWWQRKDPALRSLLIYAAALCGGYVLMHGLAQLFWLQGSAGNEIANEIALERLFNEVTGYTIRLALLKEAGLIFAKFPLLGAGFGQYAYQHLQLVAELRNPLLAGLFNNAHNIVMQLAAETGLAGLLVWFSTLGIWGWRVLVQHATYTLEQWWALAVLTVLGIHSLFEYPLWYLHFIAIAAFLLGALDAAPLPLRLRRVGSWSIATILVLGALTLWQGWEAYRHIETALGLHRRDDQQPVSVEDARQAMVKALQYPLFGSYAGLLVAHTTALDEDRLAEKLELNSYLLRYVPTATICYRQAWLLALNDQAQAARDILHRAVWNYPDRYPAVRDEIKALAAQHPARFQPLLESADRAYEEYRRAVSAR